MLAGLQGPAISLNPGDEYPNCDPAEALRLIEAGFAVAIAGEKRETTAKKPVAERRSKK